MQQFENKFNDGKNGGRNASFPFVVLVVALLLTFALTYNFYQNALNKDSLRFANEVGRVQSQVDNKINLYVALLKGGRGFIESSGDLSRESFARYIENLELEKNYAGVQGIGYCASPSPEDGAPLLKPTREKIADTANDAEEKSAAIVKFYEPQTEDNRKAIGFNMAAEENRRSALAAARDTGTAQTSAKVKLTEEEGENPKNGFLIFLPIYKNGGTPTSLEQKRKDLTGYIYSSFRADDFLSEIQKNTMAYDIAIRVFDAEDKPENLLAQTILGGSQTTAAGFTESNYSETRELIVAGRRWTIEYSALPAFTERSSVGWTLLIFVSGVIFSILLFGIAYWEVSARATLQRTAEELFELQGQKQILLEKEQKARLAAEQANRAKDDFIAVVSHELRTPLNAIAGWTNILKTENLTGETKKLALEKINKNLRAQTSIVEELLDYSQIISSGAEIPDGKINFSQLFESVFAEFAPRATEKFIQITKQNNLNGQVIAGDDEKLKLLLENLFSNAVKFTDAGGQISAAVEQEGDNVRLSIKDSGKGIAPDFLPHIFDRFRQSENALTRNFGGLGLGLAITNHIVKLHNGTIKAESGGKGKGSIFIVKFPIASKE